MDITKPQEHAKESDNTQEAVSVSHVALMQTVREYYEGFTDREIKSAILARETQAMMGCPSDKQLSAMVSNKTLDNCPVIPADIPNALAIYGLHLPGVRGYTVRKKPDRVETEYLSIPDDYRRLHHIVTLTTDILFVNGVPFLVTLSRKIRFLTAEHIPSRTAKQLGSSLMKIVNFYQRCGYVVNVIMMDQELDKVED